MQKNYHLLLTDINWKIVHSIQSLCNNYNIVESITRISLELQTTVLSNSKHTHSTDPSVHHFITLWETSATISLHQTTVLSNKRVKIVRLYLSCWSLWYFQCFDTCQTAVRHALASDANIIPETSRFLATIPCTRCWSITTKQDPRLQQTDKWQYIHSVTVTSELQQLTNVQHWITVVHPSVIVQLISWSNLVQSYRQLQILIIY